MAIGINHIPPANTIIGAGIGMHNCRCFQENPQKTKFWATIGGSHSEKKVFLHMQWIMQLLWMRHDSLHINTFNAIKPALNLE
jgi:hypothetical protein